MCGLSVPDGKSCLLTFSNICELEKYIQVAYLEYQSLTTIYFQVQFLIIEVPFEISRYLLTNFLEGNRCQQNVKTCNKNYYQRNKEKFKANYIGKCKLNKERKQYYQLSEGKAKEYSRANYQSNIETIK